MNTDDTNLSKALGVFISAMRKFTVSLLQQNFPGEPWEGVFFSRLTADRQRTWNDAQRAGTAPIQRIDYNNLTTLNVRFRDEMLNEFGGDNAKLRQFGTDLEAIAKVRNKVNHYNTLEAHEPEEAFVSMCRIARELQMKELAEELEAMKNGKSLPAAGTESGGKTAELQGLSSAETSGLTPWFDNCVPSADIRLGLLNEAEFAANLNEVVGNSGSLDYLDSNLFFQKTYVTAGLRDIASRVVRALNGEDTANRVISLQTGFGGGKTHTLIALFHIAKCGTNLGKFADPAEILGNGTAPKFNNAKIAVFTNDTVDTAVGHTVGPGLTIRTAWGEIAYQLGGKTAYEKVRGSDEKLLAPTTPILKDILSTATPALILVDELADYCCKAAGVTVGNSDLWQQTLSFMQALTQAVAQVPRCVLMLTLPASNAEVANSTVGASVLSALVQRVARLAVNAKAVDGDEIYRVVRRRLFESILRPDIAGFVAKRYREYYRRIGGNDLPDEAFNARIEQRIKDSYPFHPELIEIFHKRWGALPKFQRTRGVLRLLASIVQDLWSRKAELRGLTQMLILPADVCPERLPALTGTIVDLMGGAHWNSVMATDVYGEGSTARKIDESRRKNNDTSAKYRLAQGIAASILLASVGPSTDPNRGLDTKNIKFCSVRPGAFNQNSVDGVLNELRSRAHYLHAVDQVRGPFRFETEKNMNILIAEARSNVSQEAVDAEILRRLNAEKNACRAATVLVAPTDVPEQKQLTFVVMPPRFVVPSGTDIPDDVSGEIAKIALKRGNADRVYRNTMLYLLCSKAERNTLRDCTAEFLACAAVESVSGLSTAQLKDVHSRKEKKNAETNGALARAYSAIVKYRAKDGTERCNVGKFADTFAEQLNGNIQETLRENEWLVSRLGQGTLEENHLFPQPPDDAVAVKDIYEAFMRFDDKIMITGPQAVIDTVNRLCEQNRVAVAVGKPGNFTKIYNGGSVPLLDVSDDDFFLVDRTFVLPQPQIGEDPTTSPQPPAPPPPQPQPGTPPTQPPALPKTFKRITVSGSVPYELWTQLYTSFVLPLRSNRLEISVSFSAKSTSTNPLTETGQTIGSVRESASQLGLSFETEE